MQIQQFVGTFIPDYIRVKYGFREMESQGLIEFVNDCGDAVSEFRTDKGSTRVTTFGGFTVSMNGYVHLTELT